MSENELWYKSLSNTYYLYGYLSLLQYCTVLYCFNTTSFCVTSGYSLCPVACPCMSGGGQHCAWDAQSVLYFTHEEERVSALALSDRFGEVDFIWTILFLLENDTLTCHRHTPHNNYRRFRQLYALLIGYRAFFCFSSCKFIINEAFVLKVSGRGCQSTQVFKNRAGRFSHSSVVAKL